MDVCDVNIIYGVFYEILHWTFRYWHLFLCAQQREGVTTLGWRLMVWIFYISRG
jgi:hypothetical protein